MSKSQVFKGRKAKTSGGLKKSDIRRNKNGKLVSVKMSNRSKARMHKTIGKWLAAVKAARKSLGIKGFVAIKKGSKFYAAAKANYKK